MSRSNVLYGLVFFILTSLLVRLVHTQLFDGDVFAALADNNRMYTVYSPEERGVFIDRYGEPLVYNKPVYYKLDSSESLYSEKTRIQRSEALQVMAENPDLIRVEHEREYRYPKSLAHVIGYIGSVTAQDLLTDSSLHISDKIGKLGLEYRFQDVLRGKKGYKKYEINALGEKQHLVLQEDGKGGQNVHTTLDPYLSEVALQAMGDKRGSVVILDGETGEVLTLVSTPTFDASALSETFDDENQERERIQKVQSFFSHPQKLFFNRAISGVYPPGSVFKLLTALAGLEGEKIDATTTVEDKGVLEVGEYSYANWYYTQFGRIEGEIDLVRSISRSNDIFFYKVAEWVGPEKIKEMAQLFGLGSQTGIQLQAESIGLLPDPEWKQEVIGERWFLGNTYHMGIGQGDLLVTPLQTAQMTQAIINRGRMCSPSLISEEYEPGLLQKDRCGEVGVLEENLELVLDGMLDACSGGGTAYPFFAYNDSVRSQDLNPYEELSQGAVACKTGTSEFGGENELGYRKTHAWFTAAFGTGNLLGTLDIPQEDEVINATQNGELVATVLDTEADLSQQQLHEKWVSQVKKSGFPEKIVIVVLVESDEVKQFREGSADAAPVAKEVFDWMFPNVSSVQGD